MEYYCGIDVSLEQSSVCVVDTEGSIVREATVASDPEALIVWFLDLRLPLSRIGLEAGPLSQWLYAGLAKAGFAVELLETRHVRDAFKAMPVKSIFRLDGTDPLPRPTTRYCPGTLSGGWVGERAGADFIRSENALVAIASSVSTPCMSTSGVGASRMSTSGMSTPRVSASGVGASRMSASKGTDIVA